MPGLCRSVLVFALFGQPLMGRPSAVLPNNSQGEIVVKSAEATRIDAAPKLDGTLDDPLWQTGYLPIGQTVYSSSRPSRNCFL